ncbi:MAG: InlB B-repeat-containing protein, partial [Clostridia bacterium]|nr:InlB B-repeat-containing protein [Clostridia bacterium]
KHDGVYILTGKTLVVGEYKNSSTPLTMGTFAHELGHYLGAPDLYDTDSDNWTKYVSDMSLMCKGNHCDAGSGGSGSNPSYMDPYCFILTRLGQSTTVVDGIYTLYSRDSQEGEYNIIRINTPNPTEYYLIENRSNSRLGLSFDKSTSVYKGIVIWHIDEKLAKRGAVNTSTSGHDLGVAILSPKSVSNYECSFYNDGENGKIKYTFLANNPKYEFPVSKTWYTSMTPEQAEGFNLKVEVLSNVGSEMQIVVTGSTGNGIVVNSEVKDVTESSFTIVGQLENPNDVKISKTGIIMYDYSTGSEIIKTLDMADLHEDGTFEVKYEGLAPNTAYKYEAFASGSYGTASTEGYAKTSKVDGYAEVHLISNYKGDNKERIIQVPLGETLSFAFDYEWEGYTFGGFYFDKQWKKQFDLSSTFDNEEKITIYGKWIENKNAVMLNVVGAEVEDMYPAERSNYYRRPVIIPRENDEFIGWFLDAEFTTPYDFTKRVGDEPLTIYAKWKSDEVIIPEETTLEITTTIDVTAATTSTTEVKPQQSGGCKSIIGASSIAILVAVTTLGVAMIKKR